MFKQYLINQTYYYYYYYYYYMYAAPRTAISGTAVYKILADTKFTC